MKQFVRRTAANQRIAERVGPRGGNLFVGRDHQLHVDLVSPEELRKQSGRRRRHRGDIDPQTERTRLGTKREQWRIVLAVLDRRTHISHESPVGLPVGDVGRHAPIVPTGTDTPAMVAAGSDESLPRCGHQSLAYMSVVGSRLRVIPGASRVSSARGRFGALASALRSVSALNTGRYSAEMRYNSHSLAVSGRLLVGDDMRWRWT